MIFLRTLRSQGDFSCNWLLDCEQARRSWANCMQTLRCPKDSICWIPREEWAHAVSGEGISEQSAFKVTKEGFCSNLKKCADSFNSKKLTKHLAGECGQQM